MENLALRQQVTALKKKRPRPVLDDEDRAFWIVLGDRHIIRLGRSYLTYYHGDRSHLGLGKNTPDRRAVTPRPSPTAKVVALPRVGGIHHRYEWRAAA